MNRQTPRNQLIGCQHCGELVPAEDWHHHLMAHVRGKLATLPAAQAFERMTTNYARMRDLPEAGSAARNNAADQQPRPCAHSDHVASSIDARRCAVCWTLSPLPDDQPALPDDELALLREQMVDDPFPPDMFGPEHVIDLLDEIDRLKRELSRRATSPAHAVLDRWSAEAREWKRWAATLAVPNIHRDDTITAERLETACDRIKLLIGSMQVERAAFYPFGDPKPQRCPNCDIDAKPATTIGVWTCPGCDAVFRPHTKPPQ